MTIFLQTSSTGGPSSACFSAEAICCSVNLLLFTAWLLFYGGIMPEFLFLNGTIYWGRVTAPQLFFFFFCFFFFFFCLSNSLIKTHSIEDERHQCVWVFLV